MNVLSSHGDLPVKLKDGEIIHIIVNDENGGEIDDTKLLSCVRNCMLGRVVKAVWSDTDSVRDLGLHKAKVMMEKSEISDLYDGYEWIEVKVWVVPPREH